MAGYQQIYPLMKSKTEKLYTTPKLGHRVLFVLDGQEYSV